MRTVRPGTTLLEIVIATVVLSVLLVALLDAFSITQRQATTNEAQFNSAVLAQMIIERVRSQVSLNPRFFRDLMGTQAIWTFTGTAVEPASAGHGEGLKLCPFLEYLFTRDSTDLCTPANQISIAPVAGAACGNLKRKDLTALLETFRDYRVTVEITNDVDLDSPTAPTPLAEIIKKVTVTVARASVVAARGQDPLAYTVTGRVLAPVESLSAPAVDQLYRRFEGPTLQTLYDEFFKILGSNPYFSGSVFQQSDRNMLADAFMILAAANNESLVLEGACMPGSVVVESGEGVEFIDAWIKNMATQSSGDLSSTKRALIRLKARKAAIIFETFKKMRLPLEHFNAECIGPLEGRATMQERVRILTGVVKGLLGEVEAGKLALSQAQATLTTAQSTATSSAAAAVSTTDPVLLQAASDAASALQAAEAAVTAATAALQKSQQALESFFVDNAPTIFLCSFLEQIFTDRDYAPYALRPIDYADRFRTTLDEMAQLLVSHVEQADGVTGYERTRSAQLYTEVTMARQLEANSPDGTAQAKLKALAAKHNPRMAELSRYLAGGEVYDLEALRQRNPIFATRVAELKKDCPRFKQTMQLFQPGGDIKVFLGLCQDYLDTGGPKIAGLMGRLNQMLGLGR